MAWRPIETAPRDGTTVRLRNKVMTEKGEFVLGHYGTYSAWGKQYLGEWISDFTPDKFFPFPAGKLVIPDEWQPLPTTPEHTTGER